MTSFFKFNLQLFKGGGSSTTYNTYTPSAEERALLAQQLKYQEAFFPNVIKLNQNAGDLLWDSYGTVQADYGQMNNEAQQQIANANNIISDLQQGIVPSSYNKNFQQSISNDVKGTVGNVMNELANRGVVNSSVANAAIDDISENVTDAAAQNYNNAISTQSQLAAQQIGNATAGITTSAAAQEAAQQPALNLWNASLGLAQSGNNVLGNIAGKYGTSVSKQSYNTNSGGFGGFLGGVATGLAGNSGFWNFL
ncbi:MAG: hypothetical protein DBY32_04135 [Phascolarctobacterium sp.]|nr:MAG: hypothetical protein DBY32_04135 [Phascolarctobacterium sp.]